MKDGATDENKLMLRYVPEQSKPPLVGPLQLPPPHL